MEYRKNCPSCNSNQIKIKGPKGEKVTELVGSIVIIQEEYFIYKCSACGLYFRSPILDDRELGLHYSNYDFKILSNPHILTTITFVVIFGNIAQISTDGLPQILFYLAGITVWNYFSETLTATSNTFIVNAGIFGKVYFPRLVLPLSKVISGLIKFAIQFLLFALALIYFVLKGTAVHPDFLRIIIITPIVLTIMAGLGLGLGLILSAMTTKYRDLTFLITFGIQLGMYATPIIYPLSAIHSKYKILILANPMTSLVEAFRKVYLGAGDLSWTGLAYSFGFTVVLLILGIIIFNRVEKTFMDTV